MPYLPAMACSARARAAAIFVDVDLDADGVLRSKLTVIRFDKQFCVPLFLALVRAYRDNARLLLSLSHSAVERLAVGATRVPVDEMSRMLIDFCRRLGRIPIFSVNSVLAHREPEAALKGKIVLVGVTGFGLGTALRLRSVPISPGSRFRPRPPTTFWRASLYDIQRRRRRKFGSSLWTWGSRLRLRRAR
jgi:CHASE2 domain-containing sensor protein